MNIPLLVLGIVLIGIGILNIFLKPAVLRKVYPGWEWLEAKMWTSKYLRDLLLDIVGKKRYRAFKQEWLQNSKYSKEV